jgi:hypothetical protein
MIEVLLAVGIIFISVLAMIGLLGPTLKWVTTIERRDGIVAVVSTLNAFLQQSSDIAPPANRFDVIFETVASSDFATIFVFNAYRAPNSTDMQLKVGFYGEDVGDGANLQAADFTNAVGPIYRVLLSPSSVLPVSVRSPERDASGIFRLTGVLADYPESYFAIEVRIFVEDPGPTFTPDTPLAAFAEAEPMFTYNTALVR